MKLVCAIAGPLVLLPILAGCGGSAGGTADASSSSARPAIGSARGGAATIVTLGDSFISGEGGTWAGSQYYGMSDQKASAVKSDNPHQPLGSNRGTPYVNTPGVIGSIYTNQDGKGPGDWCHRSDSAVAFTVAKAEGWAGYNLACSGAVTANVLSVPQVASGETQTQLAQLQALVATPATKVEAVVLSIGGNDLGFPALVAHCLQQDLVAVDCATDGWFAANIAPKRPKAIADIAATISAVTAAMRAAGYVDGSYKFLYQTPPNIFGTPPNRYRSSSPTKLPTSPGVPLSDPTVSWARDYVLPWMRGAFKEALDRSKASEGGNPFVQLLDDSWAFQGHEISNTNTDFINLADGSQQPQTIPDASTTEWAVPIDPSYIAHSLKTQPNNSATWYSRLQESFHPNYYGQLALSQCVILGMKISNEVLACWAEGGQQPPQDVRVTGMRVLAVRPPQ